MHYRRILPLAVATAVLCVAVGCNSSEPAASASAVLPTSLPADAGLPSSPDFYSHGVRPILQANCYKCHAGLFHRGNLKLDTPAAILKGGKSGRVIVPGDPEASLLVKLIRHQGQGRDPRPMPPKGKLSDTDVEAIAAWIRAGAKMPTPAKR